MQSSRRRGLAPWTLAQVTPLWACAFFFTSYPGAQEGFTVFLWCFVCFRFQFISTPCKSTPLCLGLVLFHSQGLSAAPAPADLMWGIMLTTFFTVLGPSGGMTQSNAMSAKGLFLLFEVSTSCPGGAAPISWGSWGGGGGGHENDCPPAPLPGGASSSAKPEGEAWASLLVSSQEPSGRRRKEGRACAAATQTDH